MRLPRKRSQRAQQHGAGRSAFKPTQLLLPRAQRLDRIIHLVRVQRIGVQLGTHPMSDWCAKSLQRRLIDEQPEVRLLGSALGDVDLQVEPHVGVMKGQHARHIGRSRLNDPGDDEYPLVTKRHRAADIEAEVGSQLRSNHCLIGSDCPLTALQPRMNLKPLERHQIRQKRLVDPVVQPGESGKAARRLHDSSRIAQQTGKRSQVPSPDLRRRLRNSVKVVHIGRSERPRVIGECCAARRLFDQLPQRQIGRRRPEHERQRHQSGRNDQQRRSREHQQPAAAQFAQRGQPQQPQQSQHDAPMLRPHVTSSPHPTLGCSCLLRRLACA